VPLSCLGSFEAAETGNVAIHDHAFLDRSRVGIHGHPGDAVAGEDLRMSERMTDIVDSLKRLINTSIQLQETGSVNTRLRDLLQATVLLIERHRAAFLQNCEDAGLDEGEAKERLADMEAGYFDPP
jgi:hypothetical protein